MNRIHRLPPRRRSLGGALAAGVFLGCAARVLACSTPVFRYALENWEPDLYDVRITQSRPLSAEEKAAADYLDAAPDATPPTNMHVRLPPPSEGAGQGEVGADATPRLLVRFPGRDPERPALWDVPLTMAAARQVATSPAREEIARRIADGDSAVWVLLELGEEAKDTAAAATLGKELTELEKVLELPEAPDFEDAPDEDAPPAELAISFSVLRLRRDDPAEAFLVASLLRTEPDLLDFKEPMAFPVFGRGRALYALVGKGINADTIREACEFLTGACSCVVKAQNPGVDLLITADWGGDWDGLVYEEHALPPLTSVNPALKAEDTESAQTLSTAAEPIAVVEEPVAQGRPRIVFAVLATLGAVAVAAGIATSVVLRATRR